MQRTPSVFPGRRALVAPHGRRAAAACLAALAGNVGADYHHGHERAQQPARARLLPGRRPRRRRGRGRRSRLHRRRQHAGPAATERPDLRRLVRLHLRDRGRGRRPAARTDGWPSWRSNTPNQPFAEVTGPQDIDFPTKGRRVRDRRLGRHARGPHRSRRAGKAFGRAIQPARTASDAPRRTPPATSRRSTPRADRSTRTPTAPRRSRRGVRDRRRRQRPLPGQGLERLAGGDVPTRAAHLHDSVPRTTRAGVGADHGRRGQDKALYVGELTGFPFCAGVARIWRSPRRGADRASQRLQDDHGHGVREGRLALRPSVCLERS